MLNDSRINDRQAALVDYAAVRADRIQVGIRQFISSRGSMEGK